MSISFYIKNKRKIISYEPVLTVKEALALSDKELNVFAIPDMNINELLLSPLSNYEMSFNRCLKMKVQEVLNYLMIKRIRTML